MKSVIGRDWVGTHLPEVSRGVSALLLALSCVVSLRWFVGMHALGAPWVSALLMNPATALGFVLMAIGLWRLGASGSARQRTPDKLDLALAAFVTLMGVLGLAEGIFGFNLSQIFFLKGMLKLGSSVFGATAPNTSLNFFCCGLGLLLVDLPAGREFRPAHFLVVLAGLIALLALIGHTYRVLLPNDLAGPVPMTFGTALGFILFCVGFLAARPDNAIMGLALSRTTGGAMVRRLLPMAIVVPWLLGALLLLGESAGFYQREAAVSIFAVSSIVIFSGLTWWNARLLHLTELERARSERRLAVQHSATRVVAEARTIDEAIPRILEAICRTLGWQIGGLWTIDDDAGVARCTEMLPVQPGSDLALFASATRRTTVQPGVGLPGKVWASGAPTWTSNLATEGDSSLAPLAAKAGLHAAFGFPVPFAHTLFGVMEFFSGSVEAPDQQLVAMLGAVGSQLGQFIERQRAEEQLHQATANLQRSNADLQQFAYVASHDLFEPLRMVVSYLQLLRERYAGQLDKQAQEFIGFAVDGGFRMQALINDLLAYSRLDSRGRAFEPVDCEEVFDAATSNLKVAIEETKATIERGSLPCLRADAVQMTQVFQNLLGNALKFHGAEPPIIQVSAREREGEWLFAIHDNGIGIDPKHFERIFVIFQRLHTRHEYPGTGIGLAICKKIIEGDDGRIWVESVPGHGSTFFFTLPREERLKAEG